jgi:hypothetical protein
MSEIEPLRFDTSVKFYLSTTELQVKLGKRQSQVRCVAQVLCRIYIMAGVTLEHATSSKINVWCRFIGRPDMPSSYARTPKVGARTQPFPRSI